MKKTLFTITLLTMIITCNAQIAEEIFKTKYSKIGLEVGSQKMFAKNQTNAAQYIWLTSQSVFFGFNYNFYQRKNLNLKAAITYSLFEFSNIRASTHDRDIDPSIAGFRETSDNRCSI